MKKIIFILFGFFLLASCGSSDTATIGDIKTTEYTGSGFKISIPEKWTATGSVDSFTNVGNGKFTFTAVSPEKKYNFHNNITIVEDELGHIMSSKQYSEQNHTKTRKIYADYSLITSGALFFPDSDEGKYYVFDAKYNNNVQKIRMIQTAKMCGTRVYVLHASLALDAKYEDFINLFKTFSCQ